LPPIPSSCDACDAIVPPVLVAPAAAPAFAEFTAVSIDARVWSLMVAVVAFTPPPRAVPLAAIPRFVASACPVAALAVGATAPSVACRLPLSSDE
jgi:hypothetical protein